ncbi:MAG: hypothetical protein R3Y63_04720 [Eubacteriales bacterium]
MPENITTITGEENRCFRESACIHSKKIYDSCKDKDCLEDLRVYLTTASQDILDTALTVKAKSAELVFSTMDVEPVSFNRGCYTVDVRFYYQIIADAFVGALRPVEITGISVFDKRVILFGGDTSSKTFSSRPIFQDIFTNGTLPTAYMEAVDPIILGIKMKDRPDHRSTDCCCFDLPEPVKAVLEDDISSSCEGRRLLVSLGQFSIIRLERDTQLAIPVYDYCMPEKECNCGDVPQPEDPCTLFRQVNFPVDEFFPPDGACSTSHCPRETCDETF